MVVIEVVGAVLVIGLGVVATANLCFGLSGVVGAARLVRCERCGPLGVASADASLPACPRCRHERLSHPLHSLHQGPDPIGPRTAQPRVADSERIASREGMEGPVDSSGGDRDRVAAAIPVGRPRRLAAHGAQRAETRTRT